MEESTLDMWGKERVSAFRLSSICMVSNWKRVHISGNVKWI